MHHPAVTKHNLRVVTGGQTGVDLAGLRAAQCLGLKTGGYAPVNFKTSAGHKPQLKATFGLTEAAGGYSHRTRLNVTESDATLIIASNMESSGTKLTIAACEASGRAYHRLQLAPPSHQGITLSTTDIDGAVAWLMDLLDDREEFTLNVAGNSTLTQAGVFVPAFLNLLEIFKRLALKLDPTEGQAVAVLAQRFFADMRLVQALNDNFDYYGEFDPRGLKGLIV